MFEPLMTLGNASGYLNGSDMLAPGATRLFERSRHAARWKKVVGRIHGQWRRLERLECFQAIARQSPHDGQAVRAVPLDEIHGSVDGSAAFDSEFYPTNDRTQSRWVRVATAFMRGDSLPPVELIQVGERYFVLDGHHRISVARMLKFTHVDAVVTVWEATGQAAGPGCASNL